MSCPNINSPDWKALVKKHGENKAWSIFKNNDNEIPNVDSKIVAEESILDDQVIPQNKTLQEMNKNPSTSSVVIDSLKKLMPNVIINKGGIIKEDGTFVPLQPGDKGMSIRNGLHSMVAWANDAYLETPPHEYAHIYIDMYQESPLVKKAIEKYGKEKLVEKIGRYYTEQYTAPGFKRWVQKFWNMLRRFARNPDIRYELFRAFRENKVLSKNITKGTDIVEYQKAPYKRNVSSLYESDKLVNQMSAVYNFENDSEIDELGNVKNNIILNNEVSNRLLGNFKLNRLLNNLKNVDDYSIEQINEDINVLKDVYRDAVTELRETDLDLKGNYKNVVTLDVTQDLNPFKKELLTDTKNSNVTAAYSLFYLANQAQGDVNLQQDFSFERFLANPTEQQKDNIKEKAQELAETYLRIKKRTYRASQEKEGILINKESKSESASYIPVEEAFKIVQKEIEEASKKRDNKWFSKGVWQKNKLLKSLINAIIKFLSTEQSNARLQSKFLSGKDDSALQKMLYDEFENARRVSLEMQEKARGFLNQIVDIKENIDGSYFYNKNKTIENIATYEIEVAGNEKVKVTESELLSLYFNLRMPENSIAMSIGEGGTGFVIQDSIENRIVDRTYKLGLDGKGKIEKMVNDDSRLKDVVKNFDDALESMYELLSSAHKSETGISIPNIENYFPTRYGIADVEKQNQERKNIDFLGQRYAKKGNKAPIRISDAYQVLNSYINNVAHYSAYNLPVKNANKLLQKLRKKYEVDKSRKDYKLILSLIDALQGNVNNLTDNSYIYSSKSEKKVNNYLNKLMSNFSVAVLSLNVPTYFKQPISYLAAKELIDVEYLKEAGWGVGSIAGISYKEVFKQLKRKKISAGKTIFPAEWKMDENDPLYATIIQYSAILKERFKGGISKEIGEILLDSRISEDSVRIPFSRYIKKVFGKESDVDYEFSKNAMMAGIKAFDTATVVSIWKAVQLEAQDPNGPYANKDGSLMLKKNTKEYYEHVARRTEEIVNKSQPTFDLNNRTKLASSQSPVYRFITMFGSARSKLAMLIIEGVVDYQNDPTPENFKTLRKRMINITVLSAAAVVAVDLLKQFTLGTSFDDPEDDVLPFVGWKSLSTVTGNFYGLGAFSDYVASNLDDEPWRRDFQLPIMGIAEDVGDVVVSTFKGDVGKATTKLIEGTFKASGAPLYPWTVSKNIYKRTTD